MSANEEKTVNEVAEDNLDNYHALTADLFRRGRCADNLATCIEDTFETSDEITLSVTDARMCVEALRVLCIYLQHAVLLHNFTEFLDAVVPVQWTPPQADAA